MTQLGEIPPPVDPIEARTKFLKRVFPSIVSISANLSEEQWDKAVHEAVRDYVLATATPATAPTLPASHSKIEDDAELLKLRAENTNYRKIIDQSVRLYEIFEIFYYYYFFAITGGNFM